MTIKKVIILLLALAILYGYIYPELKYRYDYTGELICIKGTQRIYHKDKCVLIEEKTILLSYAKPMDFYKLDFRPCVSCHPPEATKEDVDTYNQEKAKKQKLDNIINEKANAGSRTQWTIDNVKKERTVYKTFDEAMKARLGDPYESYSEKRTRAISEIKNDPQYKEFEEILKQKEYN
jgi:hypothetical protein